MFFWLQKYRLNDKKVPATMGRCWYLFSSLLIVRNLL